MCNLEYVRNNWQAGLSMITVWHTCAGLWKIQIEMMVLFESTFILGLFLLFQLMGVYKCVKVGLLFLASCL